MSECRLVANQRNLGRRDAESEVVSRDTSDDCQKYKDLTLGPGLTGFVDSINVFGKLAPEFEK